MLNVYKQMSIQEAHSKGQSVSTYNIVLDPVDLRIRVSNNSSILVTQVMFDLSNLEHPGLLERPSSKLLGELPVDSRRLFSIIRPLDSRIEPFIFQALHRTQDSETSRIPRLHGRDQCQLRARCEWVLHRTRLLRVVAVGGLRSSQNRCEEGTGTSKRLWCCSWNCQNTVAREEGLGIWSQGARPLEEEDIVFLGRGKSVIVEVVNDDRRPIGGQMDVQLEEEGTKGAGRRRLAGEGEEDVPLLVKEVED